MSKTSPVGRCSVMCWPTSQSRSELGLPTALLYLLVKRYINMQTAVPVFSLHKSWHVNQKTMGFPVGWIFTPFYLSEFMDFSAESWHIVFLWLMATQHCGRHPKRQVSCCVMVSIALFYWHNYLIESCCPWHAIFPHVPPTWITKPMTITATFRGNGLAVKKEIRGKTHPVEEFAIYFFAQLFYWKLLPLTCHLSPIHHTWIANPMTVTASSRGNSIASHQN